MLRSHVWPVVIVLDNAVLESSSSRNSGYVYEIESRFPPTVLLGSTELFISEKRPRTIGSETFNSVLLTLKRRVLNPNP